VSLTCAKATNLKDMEVIIYL